MSAATSPVADVAAALDHVRSAALVAGPVAMVGLEVEQHVLDVRRPDRRPVVERVDAAVRGGGPLPGGAHITYEPGGQLELSGPPMDGLGPAVAAMRADLDVVERRLTEAGLSGLLLGTDPERNPVRVNDSPRYSAMADYFLGAGFTGPASIMMCSTAALQVNLDAGPEEGWAARVGLADALGPVLLALSASSPRLLGRRTGWVSSRMRAWTELDHARTAPVPLADDPAGAWAELALRAPVMMVRDAETGECTAVRKGVPFAAWVTGEVLLGGRRPTWSDLDHHLTTLWPPLRLRGSLELRSPDSCPWWAAVSAVAVACLDDPGAAEAARQACTRAPLTWRTAAKAGVLDADVRSAAVDCLAATVDALPRLGAGELVDEVLSLADRIHEVQGGEA